MLKNPKSFCQNDAHWGFCNNYCIIFYFYCSITSRFLWLNDSEYVIRLKKYTEKLYF